MQLLLGDCLVRLKELESNSIDAIVTDPPYGLSFMGKKWDYDVPSVDIWKECLRVLKHGGYLLSFAGTRTQHRMAVNIEDAGFEIRDMIMYVYGSGFPKSLNIAKSIESKLKTGSCAKNNFHQLEGERRDGRIGMYDTVEEQGFRKNNPDQLGAFDLEATTEEAKQWEGWGTALKPALEPITVARKPLEKGLNVAQNCLKWGVGGINIDGCRVETLPRKTGTKPTSDEATGSGNTLQGSSKNRQAEYDGQNQGRFPANLIHDGSDEVVGLFPQSKGCQPHNINSKNDKYDGWGNITNKNGEMVGYPGEGSAARFFYCAKASKRERNIGCEGLEEKIVNDGREKDIDNAYQRGITLRKNTHPTVKPLALMEYLVKMVSREGQVVLDPFMGSGTTGMACKKLDREFIGIEMMPEYMEIAKARIEGTQYEPTLF